MEVLFRMNFIGKGKHASKRKPVFIVALGRWQSALYGRGWFTALDGSIHNLSVSGKPGEVYSNNIWFMLDDGLTLQQAKDLYQDKAIEALIEQKNLEIEKLEERKNKLEKDIEFLKEI